MSWEGRLREAAYTPPSGTRYTFDYEDVSRETSLRNTLFQFPRVNGGWLQPNGYGPREYPLRCIFSGDSCDLKATAFELALLESGIGRLDHPLYGAFDAMPFGRVVRTDALKTAANQSIVEVTFFAVLTELYPSAGVSPRNELLASLDAFDVAIAAEFAAQVDVSTAAGRAVVKSRSLDLVKLVADALGSMSSALHSADSSFRDAQLAINYGIDLLVGTPLQLAQQVINLVQAPARAGVGIEMRLEGYVDLASRLYAQASVAATTPTLAGQLLSLRNSVRTSDLFAAQAVGGSVTSAYETTFETKSQALGTASSLLAQFDAYVAWREGALAVAALSDPGAGQQALRHSVLRAVQHLIDASFSLRTERVIVLDRPRTIIDLAGELFGEVDGRLDELITTNGLSGSEILELPRGMAIAYYQ